MKTILHLDSKSPRQNRVYFSSPAGEDPRTMIDLRWPDWSTMGEPTVITVTVEPGDHVNYA